MTTSKCLRLGWSIGRACDGAQQSIYPKRTVARIIRGWRSIATSLSLAVLAVLSLGCEAKLGGGSPKDTKTVSKPAEKKQVGKNVYFEVQGKTGRVIVDATVCLRQGQLEMLLCRKYTKEHESILSADIDARQVHAALLAAGAEAGAPVSFAPEYKPARGTKIRVTLQSQDKG